MRIVIDLQGAQTESRYRGIGRYSLSLAKAMVKIAGNKHEFLIALNGAFAESIHDIRNEFEGILPQSNIHVFHIPGNVFEANPENKKCREMSQCIREAFLLSLEPEVVLITSLFEGFGDNAVTSIGEFNNTVPVAVILYDLVPLINPDENYKHNRLIKDYYHGKIASLKKAKHLLAISENAKKEALDNLPFTDAQVTNIFGACDEHFKKISISDVDRNNLLAKYKIIDKFIMYTGGADERKNLSRLIEAYSSLPLLLKSQYQLVFVGKMPDSHIDLYKVAARKYNLEKNALLFTGYVSDNDLLMLYNCCSLFVFPSTHEGFGIPPLEAMMCGAPVIASNATSLPEIVGNDNAMFDPESVEAMSKKIEEVLTNKNFRNQLIEGGVLRAKNFSWEESAKKALSVLEKIERPLKSKKNNHIIFESTSIFKPNKKKILLIKLDHMGDFILAIPAITKLCSKYPHASVDIVVGSWNVEVARKLGFFNNIFAFDFFGKKSVDAPKAMDEEINKLINSFEDYDIAIDLRRQRDTRFILDRVKAKTKVGYETFDENVDKNLNIMLKSWLDVPFETTPLNDTHISLQMLKLIDSLPNDNNDYIRLPSIGNNISTKNRLSIAIFPFAGNEIKEWSMDSFKKLIYLLSKDQRIDSISIYVTNEKEKRKIETIDTRKIINYHVNLPYERLLNTLSQDSVCIANNSFGAHIASYLGLVVIGIYAGHEKASEWAPAFGKSYVIYRNIHCSPCHHAYLEDCEEKTACLSTISPEFVFEKIEKFLSYGLMGLQEDVSENAYNRISYDELLQDLSFSIKRMHTFESDVFFEKRLFKSISKSILPSKNKKRIFVDVSELKKVDLKSGIQRVVKNYLYWLFELIPEGYDLFPVYFDSSNKVFCYSPNFMPAAFPNWKENKNVLNLPIDYFAGDVFLGLDLNFSFVYFPEVIEAMHLKGVDIRFMLYDILPITLSEYFSESMKTFFLKWLNTISSYGLICISQNTANEFIKWANDNKIKLHNSFKINAVHLGADIINLNETTYQKPDNEDIVAKLQPFFLMVGTLEPRKGHNLVVDAFSELWKQGFPYNLVVVGGKGWSVNKLINKIENHKNKNNKLFWFNKADDGLLNNIYKKSLCIIVASEGEGFGLPLIESAQYGIPIIARDLPVFREVAENNAFYFKSNDSNGLANELKAWTELYKKNEHPSSKNMRWMSWEESTKKLLSTIIKECKLKSNLH